MSGDLYDKMAKRHGAFLVEPLRPSNVRWMMEESRMNDASDAARVKADRHERYLDVLEAIDRCKTMACGANAYAYRMTSAGIDFERELLRRATKAAERLLAALKELESL